MQKLVSTTGQTATSTNLNADYAQAFTTGSNSGGYVLTRVDWKFSRDGTDPLPLANVTVSINQDSSGAPGAVIATLSNPASLPSDGLAQFTAAGNGIPLAANTTYFAVFDTSFQSSDDLFKTSSDAEDTGAAAGWSIADSFRGRLFGASDWAFTVNDTMAIAINGYPAVSMVSNTGLVVPAIDASFSHDRGQQFTTGSDTGGYNLNSLALRIKSSSSTAPVYSVSIQGDSSGLPDGTAVGTLTTSATLSASYASVEFAASGISLSADTKYWAVIDVSTGDADTDVALKPSTIEDPGGLPGWSIRDQSHFRSQDNTGNWQTVTGAWPIELQVYGAPVDQAAPTLVSATVNGTSLSLAFNENLDSGSLPAGSAFTVSGGRSGTGTAAISGDTVSVTLDSAVNSGETVTVDYSQPSGSKLQDNAGNLVASFAGQAVTNDTPQPQQPTPQPQQPTTQTAVKLVGNTELASATPSSFNNDHAQAFTTGSSSGAYVLTRIQLNLNRQSGAAPTYSVSIHSDSSGSPGALVGTLTNPASLPTHSGLASFTAPDGGIRLTAETTYFAVIDVIVKGGATGVRTTASDDESGESDWRIANDGLFRANSSTGAWTTSTSSRKINVWGYALPVLVSNVGQTNHADIGGLGVDHGQQFTTGTHRHGYDLTGVEIDFASLAADADFEVSIWSSFTRQSIGRDVPSARVGTLSNPASLGGAGIKTFTAPDGGIHLDASTKYFVVLDGAATQTTAKGTLNNSATGTLDAGVSAGWAITVGSIFQDHSSDIDNPIPWLSHAQSKKIAILGSLTPAPLLVGNHGQTPAEVDWSGDIAQAFTTGDIPGGYLLDAVVLRARQEGGTKLDLADLTASIHSDSSGFPGTSLGTLTDPSDGIPSTAGPVRFTADGIALAADTTYWLVLDQSTASTDHLFVTASGDEDAGSAEGWSIANGIRGRSFLGTTWTFTPSTPLLIELRGARADRTAPTLESATVSGTSLSLTFNESLDSGSLPAGSAFTVSGGRSGTGTAAISGATVSVTLDSAVNVGETVTVSYAPPDGSKLRDNAGNLAARFSGRPVTNLASSPSTPGTPGPGPGTPGGSGGTEQARREPEPLQLALWADRPGYRAGETVRLYRTVDPHDDKRRYRTFAWLERSDGSERRYLAPLAAGGELHPEPVDRRGMPAEVASARALEAADRALSFEGEAPEPGLWQFVLELRPGESDEPFEQSEEPAGTRRAWAKFTVAERSLLLNRRGFDREVRSDLTLRGDTIHYLGHQLFVHDGATLTIEPGTLVMAAGRNAAIIVEPGGRIVAEGTREAPVVLTCSAPIGWRAPGCWGGLRILGRAPVTRLEGVAPGVLPPDRPVYGGSEAEGSSGRLSYVRVEFAGAGGDPDEPEGALPAIGLYGAGSGTVLEHVQVRASLGDGFAFHGGAAACERCVASGSGGAGLSWQRGWRGGASHLYVQHGSGGLDGLAGGNDEEGYDREPRSLPTLSNVTLVHARPFGSRGRTAVALSLSSGSGVNIRDLLATAFRGGGIEAGGRSSLLFREGESAVSGALLHSSGFRPLRGVPRDAVEVISRDPKLRDVRDFPNPDPRPKADSPALRELPPSDREIAPGWNYIGAFDSKENWLEEWTVFGPESAYDLRQREEDEN